MISKHQFGVFSVACILSLNLCSAAEFKPKYGPEKNPFATPLWSSHDYFRNSSHHAPQFWTLIAFYIPQFSPASCSVASVTMTLNAARTRLRQSSEDKVISEPALLDQVKKDHWKARTTGTLGYMGQHGVTLDLLGGMAQEAFQMNGFPNIEVKTTHINDDSSETKKKLIQVLEEFEKDPDIYLIANFDQKAFTNDASAGHIAPVGAYDSENQKVLILDPDREYFSPYWVSVDTFLNGMGVVDTYSKDKAHRGYVSIRIK